MGARSKPGTLKTLTWPPIPECPGGGEIKTESVIAAFGGSRYQNAPVGARSKRDSHLVRGERGDTRMPRWGRDQNYVQATNLRVRGIPECPGGGEIKTGLDGHLSMCRRYQNAPVGARSKHGRDHVHRIGSDTRMPRWGRDQNGTDIRPHIHASIPECPGGGEIKTVSTSPKGWIADTRMPRWGRDQNLTTGLRVVGNQIPECPGGGEIKTGTPGRGRVDP